MGSRIKSSASSGELFHPPQGYPRQFLLCCKLQKYAVTRYIPEVLAIGRALFREFVSRVPFPFLTDASVWLRVPLDRRSPAGREPPERTFRGCVATQTTLSRESLFSPSNFADPWLPCALDNRPRSPLRL